MQKNILGIMLITATFLFSACGGGKYDDVAEVSNKFADATEAYINSMENAEDASAVAKAVDNFAAAIEKLAPEMKKNAEKYPELKDQTNIPKELEESSKRMEALEAKMANFMMKSMAYMRNPEVVSAQKRLQKAMSSMQ